MPDEPADTHRLEGSRFISWQLCRLAAGGSRERPLVTFCPAPPFFRSLFTMPRP
jgi:hypothetical protein